MTILDYSDIFMYWLPFSQKLSSTYL